MDYYTAISTVAATKNDADTVKFRRRVARRSPEDNPRLWAAMEHNTAHRYERKTGNEIYAGFDWASILDWLKANWKTIVSVLLSLLMAFI